MTGITRDTARMLFVLTTIYIAIRIVVTVLG